MAFLANDYWGRHQSQLTADRFETKMYVVPAQEMGCEDLVEDFCKELYSPDSKGNLTIYDGAQQYTTRQGETVNNFESAKYLYYRALLDQAEKLPKDLRTALYKRDFFSALQNMLKRPSRKMVGFEQSIINSDDETAVESKWKSAFDETIMVRLDKKFPGVYKLSDGERPQEADLESLRIKNRIWSELSLSLWAKNSRWQKVKQQFVGLKISFRRVLQEKIKEKELLEHLLKKLEKITLTLPGQNPITANSSCISVSKNAYYYPYLNTLTVCAGYFNSGEQIQTLAHELAHAFDNNSLLIDFQQSTELVKQLRRLKKKVCSPEAFDCEGWQNFKNSYLSFLQGLDSYSIVHRDFHKCLQKEQTDKKVDLAIVKEKADLITRDRYSDMAESEAFFRITNKSLPRENNQAVKNPNYMNPCAYYVWDNDPFSLDSEMLSLIFFTSESKCKPIDQPEQLRAAIDLSKSMTAQLFEKILMEEGEFSARAEMQEGGYSSPSSERFADKLGSYVVADYLKQFSQVREKRGRFLVSTVWLCEKPSLKKSNSQFLRVLKDLIVDRSLHADYEERRRDWLSQVVVEQLSCEKDFEDNGCEL